MRDDGSIEDYGRIRCAIITLAACSTPTYPRRRGNGAGAAGRRRRSSAPGPTSGRDIPSRAGRLRQAHRCGERSSGSWRGLAAGERAGGGITGCSGKPTASWTSRASGPCRQPAGVRFPARYGRGMDLGIRVAEWTSTIRNLSLNADGLGKGAGAKIAPARRRPDNCLRRPVGLRPPRPYDLVA